MGGNGSFIKQYGGVPADKREFTPVDKIDGHKILIHENDVHQNKTPMNSNTKDTIYLCGKIDEKSNAVNVSIIAIYKNNLLVRTVDIETDRDGNIIPFNNKDGTHAHNWDYDSKKNEVGRKSHKGSNHLEPTNEEMTLAKKIVEYNKKRVIWKEQ